MAVFTSDGIEPHDLRVKDVAVEKAVTGIRNSSIKFEQVRSRRITVVPFTLLAPPEDEIITNAKFPSLESRNLSTPLFFLRIAEMQKYFITRYQGNQKYAA